VYSLGRKVKFRPFLVREEKILLIAKESKDPEEMRNAVRQIVQNCVCEEIIVDNLPLFDIEMIFLKIRATSVGESVKLVFNCQNVIETKEDGTEVVCDVDTDYLLDLTKVTFEIPEEHNPTVMITDKIGVKLKYPMLNSTIKVDENEDPYITLFNMIMDNVECVFGPESVTKPIDMKPGELIEFMDSLSVEHMERIKTFFRTKPKVVLSDTVACKKCGFLHHIHTEDLLGFFI